MQLRFPSLRGYMTLLMMIILGAVTAAIASTMLLMSTTFTQSSVVVLDSLRAMALADACAEDALDEIRQNTAFTGAVNLTLTTGTCSASVSSQGAELRTIQSTGTVNSIVRKVNISVSQITPQIVFDSWQEVDAF